MKSVNILLHIVNFALYTQRWINLINLVLLLFLAISLIKTVNSRTPISCDNNPCTADVTGCTKTPNSVGDICCVDLDKDGKYHCAQCMRDQYNCNGYYKLGPYRDCTPIKDHVNDTYIPCKP